MNMLTGNIREQLKVYETITADETITRMKERGGIIKYLEVTNINPHDVYIQFFDIQQGDIISFEEYKTVVAGTVRANVTQDGIGHNLGDAGDTATLLIAGTTDYNSASISVTVIDDWSFYYTETFGVTRTGTWREVITLGATVPDHSVFCGKGDGTNRAASLKELPVQGLSFTDGITFAVLTTKFGAGAPTAAIEFSAGYLG